jgi:hypothetical protein
MDVVMVFTSLVGCEPVEKLSKIVRINMFGFLRLVELDKGIIDKIFLFLLYHEAISP